MNSKLQASRPPAIVLNLSRNGLGVIRSLGRRGVPVIGVDSHLDGPGAHSRYCRPMRCPDPNVHEEALLDFLIGLAGRLGGKAVVFATSDDYVRFLSKYRTFLEERFLLALPLASVVDVVVDKRRTYEAAQQLGVPVPGFGYVQDADALARLSRQLSYPAVIKTVMSHTGASMIVGKVLRVESAEDLDAWYRRPGSCWNSVVVQEMIPGGDEALWTVGAYLNSESRPLGIFCGHKLRQYPPGFGTCSLGECAWNPRVVRLGLRLLRGIGYVGPAQVEFKHDSRDGEFKLMEINARTWLWHTLATDGEVDLAYLMYLDQIGEPTATRVLGKPGARWLSLVADTASARRYMQGGELSWRAWLCSWRGVQKLDVLSLRDPLPFLTVLWNVARRKAKAME